ncbi:MAG: hypothetical protein EPN64_04615 [Burkholderiaceae bacterium]|nr:MAG: hypothetical protein EPN64_04615 [Burkholderiaceae bacterium]
MVKLLLQLFGLLLGSGTALKLLTRLHVRQGMDEQAASDLVSGQRALAKRRAITFNCVLVAIGVIVNGASVKPLAHQTAVVLIYTGLIVLSVQFSGKWFLRPGDLKDYLLRHR